MAEEYLIYCTPNLTETDFASLVYTNHTEYKLAHTHRANAAQAIGAVDAVVAGWTRRANRAAAIDIGLILVLGAVLAASRARPPTGQQHREIGGSDHTVAV